MSSIASDMNNGHLSDQMHQNKYVFSYLLVLRFRLKFKNIISTFLIVDKNVLIKNHSI